jgi:hypothetical protein
MPELGVTGKSRGARWAYRTISWTPILILFALLAAIRLDASYDVITTLIVIGFVTLVVDVIVFLLAFNRDS